MDGSAPLRTRRATDDLPPGSSRMAIPGGLPTRAWREAAKRRKARYLTEGPVSLPLALGWPWKRWSTWGWLGLGLHWGAIGVGDIARHGWHRGWGTWAALAMSLAWTAWVLLSMRHPAVRLTESEVVVRPGLLDDARTVRRDEVVDIVEHGPGRISLLATERPRYVPIPLKHLTADERHVLARALTHYGLPTAFT